MIDRVIVIEVLMKGKEEKPNIRENHSELGKKVHGFRKFRSIVEGDFADRFSNRCIRSNHGQRDDRHRQEPREKSYDPGLRRPGEEERIIDEDDQGEGESIFLREHGEDHGDKRYDEIKR